MYVYILISYIYLCSCLSRVEKLLLSINYRFHNGRVASAMSQRQADLMTHRQNFSNTKYATPMPYTGPDYKGTCKPHCEEYMRRSKNMDMRMYAIIAQYDKSMEVGNIRKHKLTLEESMLNRNSIVLYLLIDIRIQFVLQNVAAGTSRRCWSGTRVASAAFVPRSSKA